MRVLLLGLSMVMALVMLLTLGAGCQQPQDTQNKDTGELTGELREFSVTARQWEFIPDPIEVNKGDTVKLKIMSVDVAHGFALPAFGISERLEPGKEVVVQFVADKTGEFDFFCNVPCGAGHSTMGGKLVVR